MLSSIFGRSSCLSHLPGVPHASLREDVYEDRVIPAGSIVITNIWCGSIISDSVSGAPMLCRAMAYDEEFFPKPDIFNPDRFLSIVTNENEKVHPLNTFRPNDPAALIFGFGRR